MKGKVYTAYVRSCLLYGCETWVMMTEHNMQIEGAEMRMVRWMCGASFSYRVSSSKLMSAVGVDAIGDVIRRGKEAEVVKSCTAER